MRFDVFGAFGGVPGPQQVGHRHEWMSIDRWKPLQSNCLWKGQGRRNNAVGSGKSLGSPASRRRGVATVSADRKKTSRKFISRSGQEGQTDGVLAWAIGVFPYGWLVGFTQSFCNCISLLPFLTGFENQLSRPFFKYRLFIFQRNFTQTI